MTVATQTEPRADTAIRIAGLGKRFGTDPQTVPALADIDLQVRPGEFITVVGASGCGKSTLLRIVAGFDQATSGEVTLGGRPIDRPGPDRGVVFQDYGLFPWLTVRENVMYGPREAGVPRGQAREAAGAMIETVGLTRFADRYPYELSGGMQQRVAIARVLVNEPDVLLMDEPFGALDALTRNAMQRELAKIHAETQTSVILVTHSIEEAVFLADRVVVMTGGSSHGIPGHIARLVPVDLERPRDVTAPDFNDLERTIAAIVHGETD